MAHKQSISGANDHKNFRVQSTSSMLRVLCTATHVPDIGMHSIVIKSHIIMHLSQQTTRYAA